jgi:ankyrin repeat protein
LLTFVENSIGAIDVVDALLNEGANINVTDANEENVIHHAARNSSKATSLKLPETPARSIALLRHLIQDQLFHAPMDEKNSIGNTPLLIACENGHALTAEMLIKAGADANAKNHSGQSALYLSVDDHAVLPQ